MCCVRSLSTFMVLFVVLMMMTSGDGSGLILFFKHLSQLYQGLGPTDPPPYHEPEAIIFAEPLKTPDPPDASLWERFVQPAVDFVGFRLTATQLTEIHNSVTKGIEDPKVTRMDTVVGLLARCLSEVESESKPIDTISYLVNVCPFVASPILWLIPLAPGNGYIPGQRNAQRDCFPPHSCTTLEMCHRPPW